MVSFNDTEEILFQQTVEWLSSKLSTTPATLVEQKSDLTINIFTRTITDNQGNHLNLTSKECDLLYFLYSHKGQVFTKEQLYENVWGYDYAPDAKNLTPFIRKLRKKIEPDPNNPRYIITIWGIGYKFAWKEQN